MSTNSVLVVQIPDLPLADSIANGDILILTQNHHRVDQIYAPGKDVAKKLSVSSLLNYITSQNNLSFDYGISAYNFTSIAPQGAIPFNVTSDALCPNLNVQYLNSKSSDYFINVVTNQSVDGNKTFTGTISGPTPEKDTNTDQFSTTKFVLSQASNVTPLIPSLNGTIGTSFKYAREDHKHPYNFTSLDTDIKMNGVQSKGILTTYAPADHIHPIDTSRSPVSDPTFTTKATAPYFVSTATLGTQPLQVTSSTMVTNLNANYLGGSQLSDLAPKAGSADIVTVGTVTTGTWNASTISPSKGGTGVGNGSNNTLTFTGNYSLGLTLSAATSLTLPTSGTLATVASTIAKTSATGSSVIPSGTVAQRDGSPQPGYFRYNSEAGGFEGYTPSGWGSVGGMDKSTISSNTTASKDKRYLCDTTSAAFSLTLPASPAAGDYIEVVDAKGTFALHNLTIVRNGSVIDGTAEDLVCDINNIFITFTYSGNTTRGWQIDVGGEEVVVSPDGSKTDITISGNGSVYTVNNGAITVDKVASSAITNAKLAFDGGALSGFRNVIINGNFSVNQRVYVSGAAVGAGLYGHDRWKMAASGDIYTFSTTANVTTVTIPSGKVLQQVIEGLNLQSGTYTLSWTGTAQGKIGAGSYGASGITGTATGGTNLTIEFGPGTVSKVQFEFGSTPTPFESRPYGTELALCQRYLPVIENLHGVLVGHCFSTTGAILLTTFPVTARIAPTGITYATISAWSVRSLAGGAVQLNTLTFGTASKDHAQLSCTVAGGLVAGDGTSSYNNGGAGYLYFTGCEL